MATRNDTSKPRRSRRKQPHAPAEASNATPLAAAVAPTLPPAPPPTSPRTLEEAIENVRTTLMQVRGLLHCLADVLLYSDDDDGVMHADVAQAAERWINGVAEELDLVKLRPLIEAIRQRGGGGESGEGGPELSYGGPYQVKEPTTVYLVA